MSCRWHSMLDQVAISMAIREHAMHHPPCQSCHPSTELYHAMHAPCHHRWLERPGSPHRPEGARALHGSMLLCLLRLGLELGVGLGLELELGLELVRVRCRVRVRVRVRAMVWHPITLSASRCMLEVKAMSRPSIHIACACYSSSVWWTPLSLHSVMSGAC